jgi:uncharacterized protein YrzB (UPF0473 family)
LEFWTGSASEVRHLRDSWGNQVEWYDARLARAERYEVMTEIDVAGQTYAVLTSADTADPHPYLFRYSLTEGAPLLVPIEAEEEWDQAADAFVTWLDTHHT